MGHSDSSDENAYGHESDGSSDRPAKKRNRLGTPGSFGSTSSPKKARAARPKLSSPWTYDLGLGGVAKHKNRKDLNISQGYGKKVAWPRSAGLRELIQNMFDGILAHLRESEGDNVSPRDIEVQETNPASVEQRPNQHMPFLPSGTKITFEFRRRKDPVAVPAKRKGKATDIPLLGWISIRIQYHTCDLELYNRGTPLDLDCLTFGHTSKEGQSGFIGQHGDGMKMVSPSKAALRNIKSIAKSIDRESMLSYASWGSGQSTDRLLSLSRGKITGISFMTIPIS